MFEFEIRNVYNDEARFMYGYDRDDAYRRSGYNKNVWFVVYEEYID